MGSLERGLIGAYHRDAAIRPWRARGGPLDNEAILYRAGVVPCENGAVARDMLRDDVPYRDLGAAHFDHRDKAKLTVAASSAFRLLGLACWRCAGGVIHSEFSC